MTALEIQTLLATVRELVQFTLDYKTGLGPPNGAGPLAARAIESMTGKRSGYTDMDALVSINEECRIGEKTFPTKIPVRTSPHRLDGGRY